MNIEQDDPTLPECVVRIVNLLEEFERAGSAGMRQVNDEGYWLTEFVEAARLLGRAWGSRPVVTPRAVDDRIDDVRADMEMWERELRNTMYVLERRISRLETDETRQRPLYPQPVVPIPPHKPNTWATGGMQV